MSDNLRIWNALGKTDPKHTKGFKRAGGFAGTAVKPIWQTLRLTEQFGPAGIGWGMDEPQFQTVNAGEEILVFCTVSIWYHDAASDTRGTVYGVGGDKVMGKNKYGPFTNDEAFKASYTDALSNAMKQIGVAADIHMGLFDDDKYVSATKREFEQAAPPPPAAPKQSSANGRALAAQEPQLIDHTRQKGAAPQATEGKTKAELRAEKLKAATDKRISALKSVTGWTRATLDQFWADNQDWIDWMSDPANGALNEYERFSKAFADAEVNMREAA